MLKNLLNRFQTQNKNQSQSEGETPTDMFIRAYEQRPESFAISETTNYDNKWRPRRKRSFVMRDNETGMEIEFEVYMPFLEDCSIIGDVSAPYELTEEERLRLRFLLERPVANIIEEENRPERERDTAVRQSYAEIYKSMENQ